MSDVRELLARLNPTTIRMETATGGGVDVLTNIDIAGALGMVPAGLGRDLLELLYGPDPSRADIVRVFHGITRLALEERNRRSRRFIDARTLWGIADCIAKFERDQGEQTRRNLSMLKARAAVARDQLFPEKLEERMVKIVLVVIGYMRGERLSNRERAHVLNVSESTYRECWAKVVDWLQTRAVDCERAAAKELARTLRRQ
ncbi:hypothetical protein IB227_02245 [Stenotrophomonas sp. STM01]|uniref:hypothetical protein n=1 Tax=Stenotrophomonas sp. STM01 TaxID=2769278 RepID=UPI001783FD87|nr:hypothetical protein [Stenotrophomonas sp. STM01]MBD9534670.1 hypothetical protein [Stenotrophomonas sp. STM01]